MDATTNALMFPSPDREVTVERLLGHFPVGTPRLPLQRMECVEAWFESATRWGGSYDFHLFTSIVDAEGVTFLQAGDSTLSVGEVPASELEAAFAAENAQVDPDSPRFWIRLGE